MRDLRIVALGLFIAGCVANDVDVDVDRQALVLDNGTSLNGVRLNGVRLNGVRLNGVRLNGVRLNAVRLNGTGLRGVRLDGSTLTATHGNAAVPAGELVGSRWDGQLSDGTTLPLRLDAIDRGTGANADVTIYQISYQTTGGWDDLCEGAGALAVQGTWSYDEGVPQGGRYQPAASDITFACRGFAIAKCVELGYKPWLNREAYLATCTRVLRGDFCGDGTPYTVDGTTINLHDQAGVQVDEAAWPLEAQWNRNGPRCISAPDATRFFQAGFTPSCLAALRRCDGPDASALITTELPPVGA